MQGDSSRPVGGAPSFDLRVSEELNRRIVEAMPGGIVHVLEDGTVRTANAEALRILGLSYDQLTRKYTADFETQTIFEDGSPCGNAEYPVTKALVTGEAQPPVTIGVRRLDGSTSWAVFTAVPVRDPDTGALTGAIVTFLDITHRKQLEAQLVTRNRLAAVGTLAAGVAHEINNPLTYVFASLEWLDRELDRAAPPLRQRLAACVEGVERIARIVQDLGVFTQQRERRLAAVDVHEALEASLRMATNALRGKGRVFRRYGDTPQVSADMARLGQIFMNVLINAAHALDQARSVTNEVRITTRVLDDGRVRVSIADTGRGIDESVRATLFEPFVTTKQVGQGKGLGLYVCQHLLQNMGGAIFVESEPGRGATFHIDLLPAPAEELSSAASDRVRALTSTPARVLVIEDEPQIRGIIEDALGDHIVTLARDGREALEHIDGGDFELFLCDLMMPYLSGMAVYRAVQERRPELAARFVFVTGGAVDEPSRAFLASCGRPVIQKPFSSQTLRRVVERELASRRERA